MNRHVALGLVIIVTAVFWQSYQGRQALIESQRGGCERGKKDRTQNARGWRTAEVARRESATDMSKPPKIRLADAAAALKYDRIATDLESRADGNLDCQTVFPDASPLPFSH